MSDERSNRRTSILKPPEELAAINMNKTKNDRRVSFHNMRYVQQYDVNHGNFHQEPKTEYFSLSSVSSADELTRQHAKNFQRTPLVDLENADSRDGRKSLGDRRKSVGGDDTRYMLSGKGNETANLTMQFGERPRVDETFYDDNTQALFPVKTPRDVTNTEAFFGELRRKTPTIGMRANDTMNNDVTEDFLDNIKTQARSQRDATPVRQNNGDTLVQILSPAVLSQTNSEYEMRETMFAGAHFTNNQYLEHTIHKSFVPVRDDTIPMQSIQNNESQHFGTSFQPEISSYVLHESILNDQCKSLREGTVLPNTIGQPSFLFDNTIIDDEQMIVENEHQTLIQSVHQEVHSNFADVSHQITLYDNPLMNYQQKGNSGSTRDFILENSHVLSNNGEIESNQDQNRNVQVSMFEESRILMEKVDDQENDTPPSPAYMAHEFTLENSCVLENSCILKEDEQLAEEFNRTVEMTDECVEKPERNQLCQTYAVGPASPDQTYLVATPVVKAKVRVKTLDSTLDVSVLSSASETLTKKLNETVEKLSSIESKVTNRRVSASFRQILAEVKLNRSIAQGASPKAESNCPPLKQSRYDPNQSVKNNSVALPTAIEKTPQPNVQKSQQFKPTNNLQVLSVNRNARRRTHDVSTMSTPTRHVTTTPAMRSTPQEAFSTQRQKSMASALIAKTPLLSTREGADFNPMHGPIPLKSIENIRWAQHLYHDPNWLDEVRVPRWNPLAENYFDLHGATAGMEKDELRQKAERIVVQAINKFEGKINFVRKHIFAQGTRQVEKMRPFKHKMLELKEKHDKLIEHHNKRMDHYNYLIEVARKKRYVENERFITDVKSKLQAVMSEWATS